MRQIPNSLAAPLSWVYLFLFWCKWRLVDIFLHSFFFSPLLPLALSFQSGAGPDTHGSFLLGEMLEFAVGMGKINKHIGQFWNLPKHFMSGSQRERGLTRFFLHQGLLIIFIHLFFFSLPSKIYLWIEKLTSDTAWKTNRRLSLRWVSRVRVCLRSNGGDYSGLFLPACTACF